MKNINIIMENQSDLIETMIELKPLAYIENIKE